MSALLLAAVSIIIIWCVLARILFHTRISVGEAIIKGVLAILFSLLCLAIIYYRDMSDVGVLNGQVTGKVRKEVNCEHSYECNCFTSCSGSGSNKVCTTHCSTCYEHSYDVDWVVNTTLRPFVINRVDRRGLTEPVRWSEVKAGDPVSMNYTYTNYIKASPNSLFSMKEMGDDVAKFKGMIPSYPHIYDYYKINRVLGVGITYPKTNELNEYLNMALRELGPNKQVNIVLVFVKSADSMYRYALERAWIGGKKNDVTVIIGMNDDGTFAWTDSITFGKNTGNELMAVAMRDGIRELAERGQLAHPEALGKVIVGVIAEHFTRKPMESFAYLKNEYTISGTAIIIFMLFQLGFLSMATFYTYINNIDGQGRDRRMYFPR